MKWILASERLPDTEGQFFIKQAPFRMYFNPDAEFKQLHNIWIDNKYEWLDESIEDWEKQANDLNIWKDEAMKVFNNINLQECGKLLNLPLGSDISKHILPALQQTNKMRNLLQEIDKSLYIGEGLDDKEILYFYVEVVKTIRGQINEALKQ